MAQGSIHTERKGRINPSELYKCFIRHYSNKQKLFFYETYLPIVIIYTFSTIYTPMSIQNDRNRLYYLVNVEPRSHWPNANAKLVDMLFLNVQSLMTGYSVVTPSFKLCSYRAKANVKVNIFFAVCLLGFIYTDAKAIFSLIFFRCCCCFNVNAQ